MLYSGRNLLLFSQGDYSNSPYLMDRRDAQLQAFIFDMDGVLIDSEPLDRKAWVQVLGQYGVQVSEDDILSFTGRPTIAVLEHFRRTNPAFNENILVENHEVFYELAKLQLQPMPGVEKYLQDLQSDGIPLAVASSSSHERIHFSLKHTGLLRYFQVVCSGEEVTNPKPAPDVFLHTASKLHVHPASCAVVEDPSMESPLRVKRA